jgi:hypothetical protein
MNRKNFASLPILIALSVALILALAGCSNIMQPGGAASTGSITGRALFSGMTDHSGITITAENTDGVKSLSVQRLLAGTVQGTKAIEAQATTDASGAYTLRDLPAGAFTVYASSRNSLEKAVTTGVMVVAGRSVTAADLNLTPTGQISGTATLDGTASGNLGIIVFIAGTSFCAMSADTGSYTISDVPAGTGYVLVASKQGYDSAITGVDVTVGATTTAPALILPTHVTPPATGSAAGTVRLNGALTGNTGIFVFLAGTSYITITDDAGSFSLTEVAPGAYSLVASKEGYVSGSSSVSITAGNNSDAGTLNLSGEQVSAPLFIPGTGTYSSDRLVTIIDAVPGSTIYYTTDSSAPTTSSTVYSSPITVTGNGSNATITVKAIAAKTGMTNSAVSAATYSLFYPSMKPQWAHTVSAASDKSAFYAVAVDAIGNVYAAGYIYFRLSTFTFGTGVTVTGWYPSYNLVLVKYNPSGVAQWAWTLSMGPETRFHSVAVDADGNVYAAGYITGTGSYNFGGTITATGTSAGSNVLLVKYNSAGVAQWAQTVSAGTSASSFNSVAIDVDGNVYTAGYITGTGTYNFGGTVTATGTSTGSNVVLVKYNSAGVAQWAPTVSAGTLASSFNSVAIDVDRNVYGAGYITGTGTYNFGGTVTATGTYTGSNVLLVKYNSSGVAQWAQTVSAGIRASSFNSVAIDGDRNVYAAGSIIGTRAFNFGGTVMATGTYTGDNAALVKYSHSSGTAQWANTVTAGPSSSVFNSVAVDGIWNVYAAGFIDGTGIYSFGGGFRLTGAYAGNNVVLVKYSNE